LEINPGCWSFSYEMYYMIYMINKVKVNRIVYKPDLAILNESKEVHQREIKQVYAKSKASNVTITNHIVGNMSYRLSLYMQYFMRILDLNCTMKYKLICRILSIKTCEFIFFVNYSSGSKKV